MVFLPLLVSQTADSSCSQVGPWGRFERQRLCPDTTVRGPTGLTAGFRRGGVRSPRGERSEPFSVAQVLRQTPSPAGPVLHLSSTFASRDNQEKLEQFIRQFICS